MKPVDSLIESGLVAADIPLGPLTTYKSGGPARLFAEPADRAELDEILESGICAEMPVLVLGRGSNMVVADSGYDGLVLRLGRGFSAIDVEGRRVIAGGMAPLPRLARAMVEGGVAGLEFFVGIPGSVGGAVRQNAGCFGTETKDCLVVAEIVDVATGATRSPGPEDLDLSYRHSNVAGSELVLEAVFEGTPGDSEKGRARLREITRWRKQHQPGGTLNAGSVFKNPPDVAAGELIDSLGLKGLAVGDVRVSERHANFFVAGPDATSSDIRRLVDEVRRRVLEATGTLLETEIQFVGFAE